MFKFGIVIFTILIVTESAILNNLQKCDFTDLKCKQGLYKSLITSLESGAPDMGLPPLEQIKMSGVSVTLPDTMELILTDAVLEGVKECSYEYITNTEKGHSTFKVICNLNINGNYKVKGGQDSVEGQGSGKILLDDVEFTVDFPYSITSRDGEIYLTCNINEVTHSDEFIGNIKFVSDDLGLGDKNTKIVSYLNDNSNVIKEVILPLSIDKSLDFYLKFVDKFLNLTPAKYFINGDLTPYIKM